MWMLAVSSGFGGVFEVCRGDAVAMPVLASALAP